MKNSMPIKSCTALHLLCLLFIVAANAQPRTKQVIVEGNGRPLLLLNGGNFDITSFAAHAKLLSDSFTVIRMQQFNTQYALQGKQLPADYSIATETAALVATLDSLHITAPLVVVGHSLGGVIAFDLAMHYPNRVALLVLVEAPLYHLAQARGAYTAQMKSIDELTKNFTFSAIITEAMLKDFRCAIMNCDSIDIYKHPMWPTWVQKKDALRGLSAVANYKVDPMQVKAYKKPVLIVTGTRTIDANRIVDELLVKEFPQATAGSLPGEHTAIYPNVPVFAQLLRNFVAANSQ